MRDYLFVNPFLDPPGGGEGVANWMIQALAGRGSVTVLTWDPPDLAAIDAYYGTSLASLGLEMLVVAPGIRRLLRGLNLPHRLLAGRWLLRRAARLRNRYRQCFSAFNQLDLGSPAAVQYVHHPANLEGGLEPVHLWRQSPRLKTLWPAYQVMLRMVYQPCGERAGRNITVANSYWTARAILRQGQPAVHRVLYPPPLSRPSLSPSAPRKNGFVSVGRLDPNKNWVGLIEIVERVRQRGHDVSLALLGSRYDVETLQSVQALLESRRGWLSLLLDQPRDVVDRVMAAHAFGLHGMVDEHYGMAVAELVLAGCVTFVHDSGGQVEIVPQVEARYSTSDQAVDKLCAVLGDSELEHRLREQQSLHARGLTRERFLVEFGRLVDDLESGRELPGLELELAPS